MVSFEENTAIKTENEMTQSSMETICSKTGWEATQKILLLYRRLQKNIIQAVKSYIANIIIRSKFHSATESQGLLQIILIYFRKASKPTTQNTEPAHTDTHYDSWGEWSK